MIEREQLEQAREEMQRRIASAQATFSRLQAEFMRVQNEIAREIIEAEGVIKWITEVLGDDKPDLCSDVDK